MGTKDCNGSSLVTTTTANKYYSSIHKRRLKANLSTTRPPLPKLHHIIVDQVIGFWKTENFIFAESAHDFRLAKERSAYT